MKVKSSIRSGDAPVTRELVLAKPRVGRIVTTTDFSRQSLAAVRYALALSRKLSAPLSLLHVVETGTAMSGMESVVLARASSKIAESCRSQMDTLVKREFGSESEVKKLVGKGKPFHEIVRAACRTEDWIVTGTHGRTGLKRALLGSTAERVVRHAGCPVITVPARAASNPVAGVVPFRLKLLVVPIDFSATSRRALPYAVMLAKECSAELMLLHVVETFPIDDFLGVETTNQNIAPKLESARSELTSIANAISKSEGIRTSIQVHGGSPYKTICSVADSEGADMIVLTTHGFTGLKHVWLGSTAERVVRHAACPVMVVRCARNSLN